MNAKMDAAALSAKFDRAGESVGNIVLLEHVNLRQDDQRIAGLFYVGGLGLTRDPYLHVIDVNQPMGSRHRARQWQFRNPSGRRLQARRPGTGPTLSRLRRRSVVAG